MIKLRRLLPIVSILIFFLNGCATAPPQETAPAYHYAPPTRQASLSMRKENGEKPPLVRFHSALPGDPADKASENPTNPDGEAIEEEEEDTLGAKPYANGGEGSLDQALDFCQLAQDAWQKGESDNALDALDQAYALILQIESDDDAKLSQQKEDLRFMISKRILEIYASRRLVLNGTHNEIPLTINKHVQNEIDLFTTGAEKDFFLAAYRRSGAYRPFIVEALKEAGLPEELSWLPLIESGYKVSALSPARALGLWQFIPSTGYKYGLKRDTYIDERMDPVKATHGAIAYMKEMHGMFGDWNTVLAGYNCGENRVLRVIREQNVNYLDNFWDLYERLPNETARYVPRFLATLHVVQNQQRYGLADVELDKPLAFETVTVRRQVHLEDVAQIIGTSETALKELNPELRYKVLPEDSYTLRVPPGMGGTLLAQIDSIPVRANKPNPAAVASSYHKLCAGETLAAVARRYRTSVRSLQLANNLRKNSRVYPGMRLRLPQKSALAQQSSEGDEKPAAKPAATHVVKNGETLWMIAQRFGTTPKRLQDWNSLGSPAVKTGQVLKVKGESQASPPPASAPVTATYQVRSGDSPFKIAQRHKISVDRLFRLNNLPRGSKIFPGQTLTVQ